MKRWTTRKNSVRAYFDGALIKPVHRRASQEDTIMILQIIQGLVRTSQGLRYGLVTAWLTAGLPTSYLSL